MEIQIENLNKLDELISLMTQFVNSVGVKPIVIEWLPVSTVAKLKGLSSDAVRKKLQNGNFEEGFDFKYNGSRILINQGAVERIQRERRSLNG